MPDRDHRARLERAALPSRLGAGPPRLAGHGAATFGATERERAMIRVGIGGWTYEPWRGVFYPPGLRQAAELSYASRKLTTIDQRHVLRHAEVGELPEVAGETPDGFIFALKGPRYATNRSNLAEAGPSIERSLASGVSELGEKLGPILW